MKTRLRAWLPFLILIAAAAWIVNSSMHRDRRLASNGASGDDRVPLYVAERAVWTRYGADGQPLVEATAQHIDYFEDRSMVLSTVALDRLGGAQGSWHVEAPRGIVPANENRMRLEPDVSVKGAIKGNLPTAIAASEVWVDWDQKLISSDRPVRAEAPGRSATAQGWQADFNATHVQMSGKVEMQYDAPHR
ncbi:LPS export ABC transporter periplasmic protein LptC [Solimonas soli]|uniref:LPS export ABC transporter periplasmic protein LptC n=1 Tax=Solimonas soli TaxID=413479 RepID=UPI0005BA336B|nr:LPS export ABC transporter periplasmic protein LptC [Solimonas soli]